MSMMDPTMQAAMAGMVPPAGGGAPGGGDPMAAAGPISDQELLMLVLQLIASGQLTGPGVQVLADATGGAPSGDPMAGGMAPGGPPMGGGQPPLPY